MYTKSSPTSNFQCLHATTTTRRHRSYCMSGNRVQTIPLNSTPVGIRHKRQEVQLLLEDQFTAATVAREREPVSLEELIADQHPSHWDLLQGVELTLPESELGALLESTSPIMLASDGGAVPGRGSYGWVLQIGKTIIARGKGPA